MTIRIKNNLFEWRISETGRNLGFFDRTTNRNHAILAPAASAAYVTKDGWRAEACKAIYNPPLLTFFFSGNAGSADIKVDITDDYAVFTVAAVHGDFDELSFVNIPTDLEAVPDQPFSASMIALSLLSNVEELPGPQTHLWTAAYRRFGFEGAQTGLVASSFDTMRERMKLMVGNAPGVPHSPHCGPWALDSKLPTYSNVMEAPTPQNADAWIDLCHRLGLNAIEFNGTLDYGSYQPNPAIFPNGYSDVRKLVEKFNAAGIICGLHTMSFSISKRCNWVTPKPDPRLAKERSYTLNGDLDETCTDIPILEDTSDLPPVINYLIRRSKTLQIDDELIEYTSIKTTAPYAVIQCKRGACGTVPAPHKRGAAVHHLKECWGCFAPDGDSTLFSEVADRISTAVNECHFEFVYLDGLDGSHIIGGEDARWHYGAKFTFEVFRGLKHPIMMEMATFHHHIWYVRSCMQAWDHDVRNHKAFIDRHVYSNSFARRMFLPLHLGWSGVLPYSGTQCDQTFRDDIEYLWSKALATDAHITLQRVSSNTLTNGHWLADLAPLIKTYEDLRKQQYFSADVKAKVAVRGDEFRLCNVNGTWRFLPVQAVRHQIDDLEAITDHWTFVNKFAAQPAALRIQALPSLADYDSADAFPLAEFSANDEFIDPGDTTVIRNSGKLFTYPSAAPGMSGSLSVCEADGRRCGCLTVSRAQTDAMTVSSSPDDRFSLCDHFEREFQPQEASWIHWHKSIEERDLSAYNGFGFWLKGDGKGEILNIAPIGRSHAVHNGHFFITVDFTGWRYIELLTPSSDEYDKSSWPFAQTHYALYRGILNYAAIRGLDLWCNQVAKDDTVRCLFTPIRVLKQLDQPVVNPVVTINGKSLTFPVALQTGHYLEYEGGATARVYQGNGDFITEVAPLETVPTLNNGANTIHFSCEKAAARPHVRVTMMTHDSDYL